MDFIFISSYYKPNKLFKLKKTDQLFSPINAPLHLKPKLDGGEGQTVYYK